MPVIDLRDWPMQRVEWPTITTDAFLASLETEIRGVLGRNEPYANLSICPIDMKLPTSKQRAELARMQHELVPALAKLCVADAVVMPSPVTRGVVKVINWLSPPAQPQRAFADAKHALAWIDARLARAGARRPGVHDR